MAFKRISSRKTATGYSIYVFMQDGRHVKPIINLISKYFQEIDKIENPQKTEQVLLQAERDISELERAKTLR